EWLDQRIDPESNSVSEVFLGGINAFLQFSCNQADYKERQTLLCPCARCKNVKLREAKVVSRHLFLYGFKGNYYVWTRRINGQCSTGWLNDEDNTVL
ncbi:hypothetical protein HID58_054937, partial [Brassica napus]